MDELDKNIEDFLEETEPTELEVTNTPVSTFSYEFEPAKNPAHYATVQIHKAVKDQVKQYCKLRSLKIGLFVESVLANAMKESGK